jgi:hypothetical protein
MLENGADVRHAQAMLGHACLQTTPSFTLTPTSRSGAPGRPRPHTPGRGTVAPPLRLHEDKHDPREDRRTDRDDRKDREDRDDLNYEREDSTG